MDRPKMIGWVIIPSLAVICFSGFQVGAESNAQKVYVGSEVCGECHTEKYAVFSANAKKAHSYDSVMVMNKGLTAAERHARAGLQNRQITLR